MATDEAAKRLAMQKMAFEVAWRILRVTPVNATGLVSALLLTTRGVALTLDQLHHTLQDSLDYLERKQTPMTNSALRLRTPDGVRAAVDALSNGHPVTRVDGGREPVWRIAPEDEHEAAFYRNTLIHAFLETSIVELALAYAARAEGDRLEAFWAQAMRLRDLLKFDFYFADSAAFREHVAEEMSWHEDWEAQVAAGGERDRRAAARQTAADRGRHAAAVLRGLRDRRRRAARRARRDRREGADQAGARASAASTSRRTGCAATSRCRRCCSPPHARSSPTSTCWSRRPTWPSGASAFRDELRGILGDMDKVEQIVPRAVLRARDGARRCAASPRSRSSSRATPYAGRMTTVAPPRAQQRGVADARRRRPAGRRDRRGHRRAVAGRRADRHRAAQSRAR